jgi:hypothetical protein
MIDTTTLVGIIGGLKRTQRRLRRAAPTSPHPRKVAELVRDTDLLLDKLKALRTDGEGGQPGPN